MLIQITNPAHALSPAALLAFALTALVACGSNEGNDSTQDFHSEGAAKVEVLSAQMTGDYHEPRLKVRLRGTQSVAVGLQYRARMASESSPDWATAPGTFAATDEEGVIYQVDIPLAGSLGPYGFVRYAAYAVDQDGLTAWNNNGGNDFYYFDNQWNGPVAYVDATVVTTNDTATVDIDLLAADFGREKAFVAWTGDGWSTYQEREAEWLSNDAGRVDTWTAQIAVPESTEEIAYAVRFELEDGREIWANNQSHDFRLGLRPRSVAVVRFQEHGAIETVGDPSAAGIVTIEYLRPALCQDCYQGQCSSFIEAGYRFYDNEVRWTGDIWETPTRSRNSLELWVPSDADKLEVWFHHVGSLCSEWDSNNGANYTIDL